MRESGPEYVTGAVHEAIPEKELPLKEAVTGWLYQPFAVGRTGQELPLTVGVDVSTWSGKLIVSCVTVPPVAVHDRTPWH